MSKIYVSTEIFYHFILFAIKNTWLHADIRKFSYNRELKEPLHMPLPGRASRHFYWRQRDGEAKYEQEETKVNLLSNLGTVA